MSAFRDGSRIEQEGLRRLRPWLAEHAEGGIFLETGGKGALSRLVQESIGDVIMRRDGGLLGIELKVEEEYAQSGRKNLWLEVWSNKNLDSVGNHTEHDSNLGWLYKLKGADLLLYYFLHEDELHIMSTFALKRWAFGYGDGKGDRRARLYEPKCDGRYGYTGEPAYPEVRQGKREQKNDTWGRLVPVTTLKKELHPPMISLVVSQLALPGVPYEHPIAAASDLKHRWK